MAAVTQPLKKRKLSEHLPTPIESPLLPPATISQGEILRKQRNREEIRKLYECYTKIRLYGLNKDVRFTDDTEQSYLYLITASRGCSSVQRLVADLIPKYASYCPTALEAAAKVVIDMYNRTFSIIVRGEDVDGVAFETAVACITGLIDICCTASAEAPSSTVIYGICCAVFFDVLTFFVSSFNENGLFQIINEKIVDKLGSAENFYETRQQILEENGPTLLKLSKIRACTILRIFFCSPKDVLGACLELLSSNLKENVNKGCWLLSQLTSEVDVSGAHCYTDERNIGVEPCTSKVCSDDINGGNAGINTDSDRSSRVASPSTRKCLLGLVIRKDLSLGNWIVLRLKKLSASTSAEAVLKMSSIIEEIVGYFSQQIVGKGTQLLMNGECSDVSEPMVSKNPVEGEIHKKLPPSSYMRSHGPYTPLVTDHSSNLCSERIDDGSNLAGFDSGRHVDYLVRSMPRHPFDGISFSPIARKPSESKNDFTVDGNELGDRESTHNGPNVHRLPPVHNLSARYSSGHDEVLGTGDILFASKQLWLGCLGPGVCEDTLKLQVERFGPVEQLFFSQVKGFALVKYRNIADSVRAYELLKGNSLWGAPLVAKFLDPGQRANSSLDGVVAGSSCHVYVGNISGVRKKEILHELGEVVLKVPHMVNDSINERVLLLEFNSPEAAATAINHLRRCCLENSSSKASQGRGLAGAEDIRSGSRESFNVHTMNDNLAESHRMKQLARLSYFVSSLSLKYNIPRSSKVFCSQPGEARCPSRTIFINLIKSCPVVVSDDDILTLCNLAVGDAGSITGLSRSNTNAGFSWSVDCSSVEAAIAVLNNLSTCQGMFLSISFSQNSYQILDSAKVHEAVGREVDGCDIVSSLPGSHDTNTWRLKNPHVEYHSALEKPVAQPPSLVQPVYASSTLWDTRLPNHQAHISPPLRGVVPARFPGNVPSPFKPASVTPLSQIQGTSIPQMYPAVAPPPLMCPLLHWREMYIPQPPPSPPPLPPPLPQSQPPQVPPPPSSPSHAILEPSRSQKSEQFPQHQWVGSLCKSGIQYCAVYAYNMRSDVCMYSNAPSEPVGWPAKLDMTKRTNVKRVMSTFKNTPSHRREVCLLVPSSTGDHKGFEEFISYLKERECAGVIKIHGVEPMWMRLLFILPHSPQLCSMLAIHTKPSMCLIALVLPKENSEFTR